MFACLKKSSYNCFLVRAFNKYHYKAVERILKEYIMGTDQRNIQPYILIHTKLFISVTLCVNITGRIQGVLVVPRISVKKEKPPQVILRSLEFCPFLKICMEKIDSITGA